MIDDALRIIYMGTPDFAVPALKRLIEAGLTPVAVVTQPDKPVGRKQKIKPGPVAAVAHEHNIPVLQPTKLRTGEFARELAEFKPDLFITAAYGRILPPDVLAVPRLGALNIHGSLLPRHRGASPVHASIIAGDAETGITIMMMDEGMDTGDILLQRAIPIETADDAGTLMDKLAELGADLILPAIEGLLDGSIQPKRQNPDEATVTSLLTRKDGEIDWNKPAQEVFDFVRGSNPWPGAYTYCDEKRLKVFLTRVVSTEENADNGDSGWEPGTITACTSEGIQVACGSGTLELLEIQTEAGRRMSCSDCAHNYRLGTPLGGN